MKTAEELEAQRDLLTSFLSDYVDDEVWSGLDLESGDAVAAFLKHFIFNGELHICFEGDTATGAIYILYDNRAPQFYASPGSEDFQKFILQDVDNESVKMVSYLPEGSEKIASLESVGFTPVGRLTGQALLKGQWKDIIILERLNPQIDAPGGVETVLDTPESVEKQELEPAPRRRKKK